MKDILIFTVGFAAQLLFMSRMIVQWIRSEKAGQSLSPTLFWEMSILGALLFFLYGILREDFAILFGQTIVYFIYLRNLYFKKFWSRLHFIIRSIFILIPFALSGYLLFTSPGNWHNLITNSSIPDWLILWGSFGQLIFTLRFVVQWLESEKQNESILSGTFWIISLIGSMMILSYGILRKDPVLILGQLFGSALYLRNLMLIQVKKSKWKYQTHESGN
jgi:lipid-A-disaccharide synthase-like uncharacterized protein